MRAKGIEAEAGRSYATLCYLLTSFGSEVGVALSLSPIQSTLLAIYTLHFLAVTGRHDRRRRSEDHEVEGRIANTLYNRISQKPLAISVESHRKTTAGRVTIKFEANMWLKIIKGKILEDKIFKWSLIRENCKNFSPQKFLAIR